MPHCGDTYIWSMIAIKYDIAHFSIKTSAEQNALEDVVEHCNKSIVSI
jgi:hypothetical protein